MITICFVFLFKQKTAYDVRISDWSSDVCSSDLDDAVARVLEAACDRNLMLATAESCTGGLLASLLTDVEGASHAFERGFVVYSEKAKCELLGIQQADI